MLNRRGLLTGLVSLIAAPAIVRAASIMPVRAPTLSWGLISDQRLMDDLMYDGSDWDIDGVYDRGQIFEGSMGEYRGIIFRPSALASLRP
jgi:hypothetical protein